MGVCNMINISVNKDKIVQSWLVYGSLLTFFQLLYMYYAVIICEASYIDSRNLILTV
jgi:hypothetical protein